MVDGLTYACSKVTIHSTHHDVQARVNTVVKGVILVSDASGLVCLQAGTGPEEQVCSKATAAIDHLKHCCQVMTPGLSNTCAGEQQALETTGAFESRHKQPALGKPMSNASVKGQ